MLKLNRVTHGQGGGGYLTALLVAHTLPRAQYVNVTLVRNIAGHWKNDGRENRCTVEHPSRCRLPTANPTQSGLGSNQVIFAVNIVALRHIFLRVLPLSPFKIVPPMLHANWAYVFL